MTDKEINVLINNKKVKIIELKTERNKANNLQRKIINIKNSLSKTLININYSDDYLKQGGLIIDNKICHVEGIPEEIVNIERTIDRLENILWEINVLITTLAREISDLENEIRQLRNEYYNN